VASSAAISSKAVASGPVEGQYLHQAVLFAFEVHGSSRVVESGDTVAGGGPAAVDADRPAGSRREGHMWKRRRPLSASSLTSEIAFARLL
jgi:hypothetical protein